MRKLLIAVTWTFMALAIVLFWISLRSTTDNMEYTLWALAAIVLAWGANHMLKKMKKEE